jgi:hypothetical protein
VKASLKRKKRRIAECAAGVWDVFKACRRYAKKSDWVAMQVNRRLGLDINPHFSSAFCCGAR